MKELEQLKVLAADWRKRLEEPHLKAQIEAGQVAVSPLVKDLLEAFPEDSPSPIKQQDWTAEND